MELIETLLLMCRSAVPYCVREACEAKIELKFVLIVDKPYLLGADKRAKLLEGHPAVERVTPEEIFYRSRRCAQKLEQGSDEARIEPFPCSRARLSLRIRENQTLVLGVFSQR
eukprot:3400177-Prymnesium_polylepis.1